MSRKAKPSSKHISSDGGTSAMTGKAIFWRDGAVRSPGRSFYLIRRSPARLPKAAGGVDAADSNSGVHSDAGTCWQISANDRSTGSRLQPVADMSAAASLLKVLVMGTPPLRPAPSHATSGISEGRLLHASVMLIGSKAISSNPHSALPNPANGIRTCFSIFSAFLGLPFASATAGRRKMR